MSKIKRRSKPLARAFHLLSRAIMTKAPPDVIAKLHANVLRREEAAVVYAKNSRTRHAQVEDQWRSAREDRMQSSGRASPRGRTLFHDNSRMVPASSYDAWRARLDASPR